MRTPAMLLTLSLVLVAFSGCLAFLDEDDPQEEDGDKIPDTAEHDGPATDGHEDHGNHTEEEPDPEPLPGRINGTVLTTDNATVADANLSLQGDEEESGLETTTGEDGSFLFEPVPAGAYTLVVNATCCAQAETAVELKEGENLTIDIQLETLEADPEGGQAEGGATGASLVLSDRASFELTSEDHAQIELIPQSNDPLAQLGESYSFRLYLPDGEEENHDAVNGEPIVTESVMTGTYEITIWPVVAGAIEYTVDWCAYTTTQCDD